MVDKPSVNSKRWIISALSIGVIFLAYGAFKHNQHPVNFSNTKEITLAFMVGGRIAQENVAEEAKVHKGDLLAALDPVPYQEALASAKAQLELAQANYSKSTHLPDATFHAIEEARSKMEMAEHNYEVAHTELLQRSKLHVAGQLDNVYKDDVQQEEDTRLDLERARRELAQREEAADIDTNRSMNAAAVQVAQANVAIAQTNLANTQLIAPVDGVITKRASETGATVPAGSVIYTLLVTKEMASNR